MCHLKKVTTVFQGCMYMFIKRANSVEKYLLNFRNASVSHCFGNLSLTIILNNLGLPNYKHMKRNLEFRKNVANRLFTGKLERGDVPVVKSGSRKKIVIFKIFQIHLNEGIAG